MKLISTKSFRLLELQIEKIFTELTCTNLFQIWVMNSGCLWDTNDLQVFQHVKHNLEIVRSIMLEHFGPAKHDKFERQFFISLSTEL